MKAYTVFTADGLRLAANIHALTAEDAAAQVDGFVAIEQPRLIDDAEFVALDSEGTLTEDLEAAKAWALGQIDRRRSQAIAQHLGPTAEIRDLHRDKAAEADRWLAGETVDEARSLLLAEAEALGVEVNDVASDVRAQADAARAAIRTIEGQAIAAKAAVRGATSVAAVKAAADWGH